MIRPQAMTSARYALVALILPLTLGGCISVFPKAKPVQMYRFGEAVPAPSAPAGAAVIVQKGATVFPPAASSDRILTTTGSETAYIGGARWVGPASVMFDEALLKAFDAPGSPRLVERGEPLAAASTLRLDVRAFEARYPGPTVVVRVRATIIRTPTGPSSAKRCSTPACPRKIARARSWKPSTAPWTR
ncbi:MAG: ABC-type transport auxiliary lipoprotein family protein [Caulobacteraceae bacterium]